MEVTIRGRSAQPAPPRVETIARLPYVWRRYNYPGRPPLELLLGRARVRFRLVRA